jgi:hypothetical protein
MSRVLSLIIVLCIATAVISFERDAVTDRAERILQPREKYEIVVQADVKKYCTDKGLKSNDFTPDDSTMNAKRQKMVVRQEKLYQTTVAQGSGQGIDVAGVAGDVFVSSFGYAVIMLGISGLSFIILFLWCLFSCCCKATCCVAKKKEDRNKTCISCIVWSGIVIAIASVIVTIIWLVFMGRLTNKMDPIACGMAIMKSDIIVGARFNETRSFIGTEGFLFLTDDFMTILDDIENIRDSAQTVRNLDLGTDADNMASKFQTYRDGLSSSLEEYKYPGTKNPTLVQIPIPSVNVINEKIDEIKKEVTAFSEAASNIAKAVVIITDYGQAEIDQSRTTFEDVQFKLEVNVQQQIEKIFSNIVGDSDRTKQVKSTTVSAIIIAACAECVPLVIFIVILLLNHYNKCHCLKFVNKLIMIVQILWSALVFAFAALMILLSLVVVVACRIFAGIATTDQYLSVNFKSLGLGEFTKVVDECVGPNASGDILKSLGIQMTEFNKQTTMNTGSQSFDKIAADLQSLNEPPISNAFLTSVMPFANLLQKDGPGTFDEEIDAGLQRVNSYRCASDSMNYKGKCASSSTKSSSSDIATSGVGSDFCFELTQFTNPPTAYTGRYFGRSCSPASGTAPTVSEGERNLIDTLKAVVVYKQKMDLFVQRFNDGFYTDQKNLFTKLKNSFTELQKIKNSLQKSITLFETYGKDIPNISDCRVFKKLFVGVENIVCYEVGDELFRQNGLALGVATLLLFYAWCVCCGIRCTIEDETKPAEKYEDKPQVAPEEAKMAKMNPQEEDKLMAGVAVAFEKITFQPMDD